MARDLEKAIVQAAVSHFLYKLLLRRRVTLVEPREI
jgi:hypothetical protein